MGKTIEVLAPGSVANAGCGFDMLGFAINGLGDRIRLTENHSNTLVINPVKGFPNTIPCDPTQNTAGVAILNMCEVLGVKPGFDLDITKLSPVGSGLGSSASSTTGAVFALNELLGRPFSTKLELLSFALKGESLASGSYHADNVAPSLLGGFLAIRSLEPIDLVSIPIPESLKVILIHPHLEVLTKDARGLIPQMVPLSRVTGQMGNLAAFIMGMVNSDWELLKRSFVDYLAVPYRAHLIPGFYQVQKLAEELGVLGCSISGSGPTVFAILQETQNIEKIAGALQDEFRKVGIESDCFYSGFNREGVISV